MGHTIYLTISVQPEMSLHELLFMSLSTYSSILEQLRHVTVLTALGSLPITLIINVPLLNYYSKLVNFSFILTPFFLGR